MSLPRSLALLPAVTLMFTMGAAQAQDNKGKADENASQPAAQAQKLPDGCQASMADMSKFLKLQANESLTGEVATTRHFNLAVYANRGGIGFAQENNPGSWTLVGEVRDEGGLQTKGGNIPKGAVCILEGDGGGYPEITQAEWFRTLHLSLPQAPAPKQQ